MAVLMVSGVDMIRAGIREEKREKLSMRIFQFKSRSMRDGKCLKW